MLWSGGSLCGVLRGRLADWGVGALWVLVSCWGFTV